VSGDWIVGLIAAIGSLILVGAGLRGRGLTLDKTLAMALAWAVIIGGLALVVAWFV
jgi:hypothetical protein